MLDGIISTGQLCRFLDKFFMLIAEEEAWEFWLHKETGRSWSDFRLECVPQEIDTEELSEAVENIEKILAGGEC